MEPITCFWAERLPLVRRSLRRFSHSDLRPCAVTQSYCNAMAFLDEVDNPQDVIQITDSFPHEDPRWPTACEACKQPFAADDEYQVWGDFVYTNTLTGERWAKKELPFGAMYHGYWMPFEKHKEDGYCVILVLPDSTHWCIDGPSYNHGKVGAGWTRTGVVPKITVNPSILTSNFHGWVKEGILTNC